MLLFPQGACPQLLCVMLQCVGVHARGRRGESPPSPSEDPGQGRLQPSGVRAALPVSCLPVALS